MLTIPLNKTGVFYGIQIKGLEKDDMIEDDTWETVPLHIFQIPDPGGGNSSSDSHTETEQLQPVDGPKVLQIVLPILSVISVISIVVTAKYKCRNRWKKFYYLEERREMPGGIANDYNDVHHRGSIFTLNPVEPDRWEVPHSSVKVGKILGCGAFGQVVKGRISKSVLFHRGVHIPNGTRTGSTYVSVAVKMLQEETLDSYKEDFLREINLMKTIGYHPHVVNMLGCCTLNDPICLIVEHVPYGDMLSHLKKIRQKIQHRESTDGHYVNRDIDILSPTDLLSFARQIAIGMEFLSQKGFVHRDLAARNILVGYNKNVKIGDFGLTRYIYNDSIYINRKGGRLPLKWMSIEAIFDLTFSTASDVWSFGVVLFEIVTLGGTPYPTLDPRDLLRELKQGYRMEKPDNCSDQLYQVMLKCWEELPDKRPTFSNLRTILDDMLEETSGVEYLHFRLDDSKNYYSVELEGNTENENIITDDTASFDMTENDRIENDASGNESEIEIENTTNVHVKRTRFSDVTVYISDECQTDAEDDIEGVEEKSDPVASDKNSVEKDTSVEDNDHNDIQQDEDKEAKNEKCFVCSKLDSDSNSCCEDNAAKSDVKDDLDINLHSENQTLTSSPEVRIPKQDSLNYSPCVSDSHYDDSQASGSTISDTSASTTSDMIASNQVKTREDIGEFVRDSSPVFRTSSSSSGYDDEVFIDDDKTLPLVCQRFPKTSNSPFYLRRGFPPGSLGYGSGSSHNSSDVDDNQFQSVV